jgi:Mn-dependent DtxR family transcriptional regulator
MDAPNATPESTIKPFQLTASLEDYLETIKLLIDQDPHGHAHTSTIAKALKVKMPSVTNALGILCRNGYIHYDTNYPVTLTPLGEAAAVRILQKHDILSRFLQDILQMEKDSASHLACKIEHVITDDFIQRLEALSRAIDETGSADAIASYVQQYHS